MCACGLLAQCFHPTKAHKLPHISTIKDLTEDNAGDLVQRVGVRVRARAVCAPALTELIQAAGVSTQKTNVVNIPKILKTNDNVGTSGTGGTPSGGDNPNDGND